MTLTCQCECDCSMFLEELETDICTYCINGDHEYDIWDDEGGFV